MRDVDDTRLMSYVDGELDAADAREVEASLFRDPVRTARVREMRVTSALVRAAFNHALYGAPPVPVPARRRRPRLPTALAASVAASVAALALGFVLGGAHAPAGPDVAPDVAAASRAAALQRSLEDHPSGTPAPWAHDASGQAGRVTPVSSYRSESGRFCREFEEVRVAAGARQREAGVACRGEDGRWRVRVRYYP